jgi:hypothetical protein
MLIHHQRSSHMLPPGISPLPVSVHTSQQLWVVPASPVYNREGWGEMDHGSLPSGVVINVVQ